MSKTQIAFQGKVGAYSYLACKSLYPKFEAVPCFGFKEVFNKVESGEVKLGLVPIENSTAGRVVDVHDLMRQTDLHIIREIFVPIHHCLLAPKGASVEGIKTVYSHIQALSQCMDNINELGITPKTFGDTAGAACKVSEKQCMETAAVASKQAAKEYGLEILRDDFQDKENNVTRFLVLSKENKERSSDTGNYITTIFFEVKNIPSALYKVLGAFATNNINISKIESYMNSDNFKSAEFFIDVESHINEKCMKNAIKELELFVKKSRVVGCYPAHKLRRNI